MDGLTWLLERGDTVYLFGPIRGFSHITYWQIQYHRSAGYYHLLLVGV